MCIVPAAYPVSSRTESGKPPSMPKQFAQPAVGR